MTRHHDPKRGANPSVAAAAKALGVDGVKKLDKLAGGAPPATPRADQCVECGRTVNLATQVSHGLRGLHTCRTPAGDVPPYLDPMSDEERGACLTYQERQAANRSAIDNATHGTSSAGVAGAAF